LAKQQDNTYPEALRNFHNYSESLENVAKQSRFVIEFGEKINEFVNLVKKVKVMEELI